ncbi:MAG: hypothetical protein GMKNLPBB_01918 [Myxococcota bacterium]|nr:hypothetical protein [Myxococcota bacterium]
MGERPMVNYHELSSAGLHELALKGDEGAWRYIHGFVFRICSRYKPRIDPADVAQEIVMRLISGNRLTSVRDPVGFRGFLKTTASRVICDKLRKRGFSTVPLDVELDDGVQLPRPLVSGELSPDHQAELEELQEKLHVLLAKMGEPCATILREYLKYKLGVAHESHEELARALGRPAGTVAAQTHRCIKALADDPEVRKLFSPEDNKTGEGSHG